MIFGGGPAGYVAAERAGQSGLSVVLFEQNKLGGVCLNEGCIPTKTLLYGAKQYEQARMGDKYGVFAGELRFDYGKMVARKDKVVRKLVAGVDAKMKENQVTVVKGKAQIVGKNGSTVEVICNEASYVGKNLLICTGSEAYIPPIPGLDSAEGHVLTNRELLALKEQPASLVIVGGGVIGMEFASLYNSLGIPVTVIELLPEILGGLDGEISAGLREIYTKKGVVFELNAKVVRIEGSSVTFEKAGETKIVTGDKILLSVGRRAVTEGFGLETLGVALNRSGIVVDSRMQTSVEGVYAAGDVTGFSLLAHTASREGEVVVNNLLGRVDSMHYDAIPGVVYTNPEVACVGLTGEQVLERVPNARIVRLPMAYSGRFVAENEGINGVCKVILDAEDKVLGVHILGNPASELIAGACILMEKGMRLSELEGVVFPHPTVSEILREAAFSTN